MKKLKYYIRENVRRPVDSHLINPIYNHLVLPIMRFTCRKFSRAFCLRTIKDLTDEIEEPTLPDSFYPTLENLTKLFEIEDAVAELNFFARQARISEGEQQQVRKINLYFGFTQSPV